jgi:hypothetical protein
VHPTPLLWGFISGGEELKMKRLAAKVMGEFIHRFTEPIGEEE